MENLQQLFSHELRDIYAGEREVVTALEELEQNEPNQQLAEIFARHREETRRQIDRLESVFEAAGESPEAEGGQGLRGIIEEHESFVQTRPTDPVHAVYDAGAGKKVERYEITAYEDLLRMGQALGLTQKELEPLEANLSEEKEQLDRLRNFAHDFDLSALLV